MTLTGFGLDIPSFTYPGINDAGLDRLIFDRHDATDLAAIAEAATMLSGNFGVHPSR